MVPKPGSTHNLGASTSRGDRRSRRERRSRSPPAAASSTSRQNRSPTSFSSSSANRESRAPSRLRSTVRQLSPVGPRRSSNRNRRPRSRSRTPTTPTQSRRFRTRSRSLRTRSRSPQLPHSRSTSSDNRTPVWNRLGGRSSSPEPPPTTSRQVAVRYAPTDRSIPIRGPDARANPEVAEANAVAFQNRLRELRPVDQLSPDTIIFTAVIPVSDRLLQGARPEPRNRKGYGDQRPVRY